MRVAILGAGGQLGRALTAALPDADAFTRDDLDITDAAAVSAVGWTRYDTVFNAAAFTAVDAAETPEGRVSAWHVNATAVAHLARAARTHDFTLVHLSTEYVFDGAPPGPIPEDAPLSPLSAYGASKAAGELAATLAPRHYVVRTSWVVGEGGNFVRTMAGLAARGVSPTVVADQIGRPTFADDLAAGMVALLGGPVGRLPPDQHRRARLVGRRRPRHLRTRRPRPRGRHRHDHRRVLRRQAARRARGRSTACWT